MQYGCLARVVREGGFKIALIARFSAIPGHCAFSSRFSFEWHNYVSFISYHCCLRFVRHERVDVCPCCVLYIGVVIEGAGQRALWPSFGTYRAHCPTDELLVNRGHHSCHCPRCMVYLPETQSYQARRDI